LKTRYNKKLSYRGDKRVGGYYVM